MHHEKIFKKDTVVIDNERASKIYGDALTDLTTYLEALEGKQLKDIEDLIDYEVKSSEDNYKSFVDFIENNKKYIPPSEFNPNTILRMSDYKDTSFYYSCWIPQTVHQTLTKLRPINGDWVRECLVKKVKSYINEIKSLKYISDMAVYAYAVDHSTAEHLAKLESGEVKFEDAHKCIREVCCEISQEHSRIIYETSYRLNIEKDWHQEEGCYRYFWKKESEYMKSVKMSEKYAIKDPVEDDKRSVWQYIKDCFKGNPQGGQ